MSEIALRNNDHDLISVLKESTNEELEPLVNFILGPSGFRMSSELELTKVYKENKGNHKKYVLEIAAEIQKFGAHTLASLFRGGKGIYYREVVEDVAKKMKVKIFPENSTEDIENKILIKFLEQSYEKMPEALQSNLLDEFGIKYEKGIPKKLPVSAIQALMKAGKFKTYKLAAVVSNGTYKAIMGRGLSFAFNKGLAKAVKIFSGPVGLSINSALIAFDLSAPSYKVTVPCVVYISYLRQEHAKTKKSFVKRVLRKIA